MNDSTRFVVLTAAALAALAGGCDQRAPTDRQTTPATPTASGPGMNGVTDSTPETTPGTTAEEPALEEPLPERPDGSALEGATPPDGEDPLGDGGEGVPTPPPGGIDENEQDALDQQAQIDAERAAENVAAQEAAERYADRDREEYGTSPEMAELLGDLSSLGGQSPAGLDPVEARQQPGMPDAVAAWGMRTRGGMTPEEVGNVDNTVFESAAGELPVRVYWPMGSGEQPRNLPMVVFYHGGGFVIGDVNGYDASARAICNAAECIVVAPSYRQAPEAPFPAATEDALAAYQWAVTNAPQLGGDSSRVAVAGESAGGNLAAVVSLSCREQGMQMPVHQVLIYPVGDWTFESPSYEEFASASPLSREMMEWFRKHYLGTEVASIDWRAAPLRAESFERLPPTTIITAQIDPLRSDGEMLAAKLQEAGVAVNHVNFEGVTHEFFGAGLVLPQAKEAVRVVATDLRNAFGSTIGGVETDGQ